MYKNKFTKEIFYQRIRDILNKHRMPQDMKMDLLTKFPGRNGNGETNPDMTETISPGNNGNGKLTNYEGVM